jgi:hypothetical protein
MGRSGDSRLIVRIRSSVPSSPSGSCKALTRAKLSGRRRWLSIRRSRHGTTTIWISTRDALAERVHLTLKDVVPRAENIGCELVIENIEDKDPLAASCSPGASTAPRFGFRSIRDMRITRMFPPVRLRSTITSMPPAMNSPTSTFRDTDGYSDRHWLPGDGSVRWAAVFRGARPLVEQAASSDRGQGSGQHSSWCRAS